MEQMNCGGEVCLARAEKYADWGIEIKVRFRNKDAAGGDGMAKVITLHTIYTVTTATDTNLLAVCSSILGVCDIARRCRRCVVRSVQML
jgi:hypothetical protein